MIKVKRAVTVLLVFCLIAITRCSNPSKEPIPLDLNSCIRLNIIEESATFQGKETLLGEGVYVQFTPNLKAPHTSDNYDRLVIKFRTKEGYKQVPGTFDMGSIVNLDHNTCEQCVEVIQDVSGDHIQVRNFQIGGTITVDSINTETGESAGKIENAYFKEIDESGYTDYDSCLTIETARWNTFTSTKLPEEPIPLDLNSCIRLNIIEESATFQGKGTFWGEGVYVQFTPNLKAPHTSDNYDRLVIKFRTKGGYKQVPGTFDMGSIVNLDHTTCEQCVEVIQDVSGDHIQVRNFQIGGTITVDSINTATGESAGKIENAYFREIDESGYYTWGGYTDYDSCLTIETARWNTFSSNNRSCGNYSCPNQKLQSCNPYTGKCEPSPCGGTDTSCENGGVCLPQEGHYRTGACYTLCDPFKECPPGYDCIPISYDASRGILKKVGLKKEGEQCTGNVLSSDCEMGTNCSSVNTYWSKQTKCFRHCDIFSDSTFCSDGRVCALYAYQQKETTHYCYGDRCFKNSKCLGPKDDMDTVAMFGKVCSKAEGRPCNVEGSKATGLCVAVSKDVSEVKCFQLCRQNQSDCPSGKSCQEVTLYINDGLKKIVLESIGICK